MKKHLLLITFLSATVFSIAQTWTWQNPLPQGNDLKASCFVDNNNGYLVGRSGTVMKTTDGGATWILCNPGQNNSFYGVDFIDINTGFVCGEGEIYKTTNGGTSWTNVYTTNSKSFMDIDFIDVNTGFVVSESGTAMMKTTDGGATWTSVTFTSSDGLNDIYFADASNIYAVGENGFYTYSSDGGATWTETTIGANSRELFKIYFTDNVTAFAIGYYGSIFKSTDGAITWNLYTDSYDNPDHDVNNFVISDNYDMYFTDANTGFIIAGYYIWKTTDTGTTWVKKMQNTYMDMHAVLPTGTTTLYAAGDGGLLLKTTDSGETWDYANSDTPSDLTGIDFVNENLGFAVGDNNAILKTTAGGEIWNSIYNPGSGHKYFNGVDALDENHIYIANASGSVFYTTDGGASWTSASVGGYDDFFAIQMLDANTGYACGEDGLLAKTTNGTDWTALTSPVSTDYNLNDLYFFDTNTGFVIGGKYGESKLFKTADGGANWTEISLSITQEANSITFVSETVGYLVADNAAVMKTTDGGANWTAQSVSIPSGVYFDDLFTVAFFDADFGVIGGASGLAFYTENGGANWTTLDIITSNYLKDVSLSGANAVFAGNGANIIQLSTNYSLPTVSADFSADIVSGDAPLNVQFTDESTGQPTSWSWDFDNDGTEDASEQNPNYTYATAGTYSVNLTVSNAGSSDSETKTNYITVTAPASGMIVSTTTGGNWNSTTTWQGGVVPQANDSVAINGEVFVTEGSECAYLVVSNNGILLNAASNYGITLPVAGDVVNNGTITRNTDDVDAFAIKAYKNIVNNGSWDNQYLDLYGTADQTISGTGEFGYMAIEDYDSTTAIIAGSNLTFNNTDVRLARTNFVVNDGVLITVKNTIQANATATIGNGKISGSGEISFENQAYLGENTSVSGMRLSGTVRVHYNVHFGASVIIMDTLMQKANNYPTQLFFDENFTNNAVIMNNPDDNDALYIYAAKNATNNNIWENGITYVDGEIDQTITCVDHPIAHLELIANVEGASTYQWKKDGQTIADATNETLVIENTNASHSGVYTCTTDAGESRIITINAGVVEIVAAFSVDATSGDAPLTVNFTDESTGDVTAWYWYIDSEATPFSTDQNPSYQFTEAGTYSIALVASDGTQSDDTIRANLITVTEVADCLDPTNYSMNFESDEDLAAWSFLDTNNDDNTWVIATGYGVNDSYCAGYGYSSTSAANDWLFTPCFDMVAGKSYTLEFKYAVAGSSFPEKLAIGFGTVKTADIPIALDMGTLDNTEYQTATINVAVTETDSYYFGWHCYSDANMYNLYIDEVKITEAVLVNVNADFSADVVSGDAPLLVNFTDLSDGDITNWAWDFDNDGTVDSYDQNPAYTYETAGTYSVKLTVSNGDVSDEMLNTDYITVTESVSCEDPTAYAMNFESDEDLAAWSFLDTNNDNNTWVIATSYGVNDSYCAGYGYSSTSAANDWLFTPCFDMVAGKSYTLEFKYAVAESSFPEKLAIGFGTSKTADIPIVEDMGTLDNTEYQTTTISVDVYETNSYYFGWHCYSDANMYNLYIDEVKITEATSVINTISGNEISLYPNPASSQVTILIPQVDENTVLSILTTNGQMLNQQKINQTTVNYDISNLNRGIYFIKLSNKNGDVYKKLVVY